LSRAGLPVDGMGGGRRRRPAAPAVPPPAAGRRRSDPSPRRPWSSPRRYSVETVSATDPSFVTVKGKPPKSRSSSCPPGLTSCSSGAESPACILMRPTVPVALVTKTLDRSLATRLTPESAKSVVIFCGSCDRPKGENNGEDRVAVEGVRRAYPIVDEPNTWREDRASRVSPPVRVGCRTNPVVRVGAVALSWSQR